MKKILLPLLMLIGAAVALSSCNDSKSYAEMLEDENHAVNKFLVEQRVVNTIPADSVFEVGPDAPYYRIDDDGDVYMQVLSIGNGGEVKKNARVYFRCNLYNLFNYRIGDDDFNSWIDEGNATLGEPQFFLFGNTSVSESSQHGTGIQLPLRFFEYNTKVNLLIKSQAGATSNMSNVIPYLYTITYFKSMI